MVATLKCRSLAFYALIALIVLAAIALRWHFLQVGLLHLGVNSDELLTFFQAREIARGAKPLLFWTQPYQFPFEAYLLSYFVEYLPWNSWGVRILQLTICLLAVPGFLILLAKAYPLKHFWPGALLILFPSSYWFTRQVGLMTPQHAMAVAFACLIPFGFLMTRLSTHHRLWCSLTGLSAGMALSNHLLSLSLVAPCILAACLGRSAREAKTNTVFLLPGFAIGLAPYLYARVAIPGAYQRVADTLPLLDGIKRLWDPVIKIHIPFGLGIIPTYIPDTSDRILTFRPLLEPSAYLFVALLVYVTVLRSKIFFAKLKSDRWIVLDLPDVMLGTTILGLLLLCLTGMDLRTRYALPIIWAFPFLLCEAFTQLPRLGRYLLAAVSLFAVYINVSGTLALANIWQQPHFSERYAVLPSLAPLYKYLQEQGITRCYASWWDSYRITFDSQERIICSPPFNDRFPGWPQPHYRLDVDEADKVAYVLGPYAHPLLRPNTFFDYLNRHLLTMDSHQAGSYLVLHSFRHKAVTSKSVAMPKSLMRAQTTHNSTDAIHLVDDDWKKKWSSKSTQSDDMSITVTFSEASNIHAVGISTPHSIYTSQPPRLRIEGLLADGSWHELVSDMVGLPYPLRLAENITPKPISGLELTLGFRPITAKAVRLRIVGPQAQQKWTISELTIYEEVTEK